MENPDLKSTTDPSSENMPNFIDVILPIPLERVFTYRITPAEAGFLTPGMRVAVPFGKSKIYTGLVYRLHQVPPQAYDPKDIYQILDDKPLVTANQFKLWEWMATYYMCTLGDTLRAALPSAFLIESETIVVRNPEVDASTLLMGDQEQLVYEALKHQPQLKVNAIAEIIAKRQVLPILKRFQEQNLITLKEELYEKYRPKLVRFVRLDPQYQREESLEALLETMNRAPKQRRILLSLFGMQSGSWEPVRVAELLKRSQGSAAQVKALIDKGVLEESHQRMDRIQYSGEAIREDVQLNELQSRAFNAIKAVFEAHNVALLHGVTASGKTEIYVRLIREALDQGQNVLYLLPEIALTTQLVQRLQRHFGEAVAVYHSRYSLNERVETWNNVLNGSDKARIVLGARSAVLLPLKNLGLVVVDEEHEQSFKQFDPAPRYHARDTAIVLASLFKSKVILGSATPALESYYNATVINKYGFAELNRRYNNVLMPEMELVDLKDKYRRKRMKGHFSDRLIEEIQAALAEQQQVILFQNRRGFSPIVECLTCGHSPQCPNCDVSLTYHQYRDQLRCHYCGHAVPMIRSCPACTGPDLDTKGFGTEQVEEEARALFAEANIRRMDLDSTRGKYAYQNIIAAFEQQEIDILVGTQMLTKGLDFRHVKVVGVMNADSMLNFPDFRAHERSFQLIQQVAGRAGRTAERGKVIIQTFNPYHQILQQVSVNDYEGMFTEQLEQRRIYKYPPYFRLIKITLRHKDINRLNSGADWMAKALRSRFGKYVLGPEFPPVARIRNQYNKNILIKIPQEQSVRKTKEAVLKIKNSFLSIKDYRSVKLVLNVDNY